MPDPKRSAVVEVVHKGSEFADLGDNSAKTLRAVAASEAFRKYEWLKRTPGLNSVGDLRGMVVSAKWRTVYNVVGKYGEDLGRVAFIASFAVNVLNAKDQIETTLKSKDDWQTKGSKLSIQASSIALKTLGGVIPASAHILSKSLQGYCGLVDVIAGRQAFDDPASKQLDKFDKYVSTTFDKITDANNMYIAVTVNVDRLVRWGMNQ